MKRITLLLADDHDMLLDGLVHMLRPDFDVVGVAHDGRTMIEIAKEKRPRRDRDGYFDAESQWDRRSANASTGYPFYKDSIPHHAFGLSPRWRGIPDRRFRICTQNV